MKRKRVVVLGATGSIGESSLKVARDIPDRMEIVGLAANSNAEKLAVAANETRAGSVCLVDESKIDVLRKALQQMDTLMHQAIPGLAFLVFECRIAVSAPFREERGTRVFTAEESAQGVFKRTAEHHGSASFFFSPAIQVSVSITTRATQVLVNLRKAIGHGHRHPRLPGSPIHPGALPNQLRERRHQGSDKNARSARCVKYG